MTQTDELRERVREHFCQIAEHAVANQLTPADTLHECDRKAETLMALMEQVRADERERLAKVFEARQPHVRDLKTIRELQNTADAIRAQGDRP